MFVNLKKVVGLLWVGEELLPQVEECRYLSLKGWKAWSGRLVGCSNAVTVSNHCSERELSEKVKISIYGSKFLPSSMVVSFGS